MNQSIVRVRAALTAGALLLAGARAQADIPFQDHFTFSGFGTLGYTQTDTDEAEYVRTLQADGATTRYSFDVDSDLGLQVTGKANDWLSGTVQILSMQRTDPHLTTEVEWAFAKVAPLPGLAIRGGRMALPTFTISDSRNVGYANNWVRPPDEVYGLALFSRLDGADASYRFKLGGTGLTVSALAGQSRVVVNATGQELKMHSIRGASAQLDTDWLTVRAARISGHLDIPQYLYFGPIVQETYTFSNIGATVDHDNLFLQAEYAKRTSKLFPQFDASGWYLIGGYRFGEWLPFVEYSTSINSQFSQQSTTSVGARWNAFNSADIKMQLDRVDPKGGTGMSFLNQSASFGSRSVTVGSIAVDFVF